MKFLICTYHKSIISYYAILQIYDHLKVNFSVAENEEKANLKAHLAFKFLIKYELNQHKKMPSGRASFRIILPNGWDKLNFWNQCKIIALPSKKPPSGPY